MTHNPEPSPTASSDPPGLRLPWLLLLFVGSGCAALIYEIVWFQMLELVIGSSSISLGVLLGTYMGGMCLGSLLIPRWITPKQNPLRVYALLELGIGACGLVLLGAVPAMAHLYAAYGGSGFGGVVLRGLLCAVLLLPPTLLMGGTLPAIARWVESSPRGVSWLGFFYGGNIAGAVLGCLLAGFFLLRLFDVATTSVVAVAINAAVGGIGLALSRSAVRTTAPAVDDEPAQGKISGGAGAVYLAIALSGTTALGSEVVWTRLLSLLFGGTVYTFSLILAVFLTGLGLGSAAGSSLARRATDARVLLGTCQLLLAAAIAWAGAMLTRSLPFWPIDMNLNPSMWVAFQLDLLRSAYVILPGALLWGASFPLALAAVADRQADTGRVVGRLYAANTVGAIVGSVATGVLLIGWLGTQRVQQTLIGLSVLSALVVLAPIAWPEKAPEESARQRRVLGAALVVAMIAAVGLMFGPDKIPWQLVAYGKEIPTNAPYSSPVFVGEGVNSSVAVTRWSSGERSFHVAGKVEASTVLQDMRLQRMIGHIPALFHREPHSVLIVGCGAGVTAGSFVPYPSIKRIVICELEPLIPRVVAEHFSKENNGVVHDPRVQVVFDDARHFILTTHEKFDIITSDPINPWVKGAATLYTQDYFELCKRRLNPGGLVTQWVPLYESTADAVKSEVATFFRAFPGSSVWGNDWNGEGYDTVVLGSVEPQVLHADDIAARLERPDYAKVKASLAEVNLGTVETLLGTYAGRPQDMGPWLAHAQINRDQNLRLQYLAGFASSNRTEGEIYREMLKYRRFPEGLIVGSRTRLAKLRSSLQAPPSPEDQEWLDSQLMLF